MLVRPTFSLTKSKARNRENNKLTVETLRQSISLQVDRPSRGIIVLVKKD